MLAFVVRRRHLLLFYGIRCNAIIKWEMSRCITGRKGGRSESEGKQIQRHSVKTASVALVMSRPCPCCAGACDWNPSVSPVSCHYFPQPTSAPVVSIRIFDLFFYAISLLFFFCALIKVVDIFAIVTRGSARHFLVRFDPEKTRPFALCNQISYEQTLEQA